MIQRFNTQIKALIAVLLLFSGTLAKAQISIVTDNATNLVQQVLVGAGVQVSNITSAGDPAQIGRFSNGNSVSLGINNGVVMTVGNLNTQADQASGFNFIGSPATQSDLSTSFDNNVNITGDPDLTAILSQFGVAGGTNNNVAVIEFDFIPAGDSLRFTYVFGSEEYGSYVCSQFFDAFGFFLSGPGINGPYTGNAVNLALVPGTNLPVGINTINDGVSDQTFNPICPPGGLNNTQYYFDNSAAQNFAIEGYTVPLVCEAQVVCGETYHIKLVIANGTDTSLDSWVFLEAESFSTPIPNLNIANLLPDTAVIEGCLDGEIVFTRNNSDELLIIPVTYEGTAEFGVDYTGMPDTLIFPVGVDSVFFTLSPVADGINEGGIETIIIGFRVVNDCGDTVSINRTIKIRDPYELTLVSPDPTLDCPTPNYTVGVQVSGGYEPYQFQWSVNNLITPTINVPIFETQTFTVQITDSLDCEFARTADTITVTLTYDSLLTQVTQVEICAGDTVDISTNAAFGLQPYTFNWGSFGNTDTIQVTAVDTTVYYYTITDACGISRSDSVEVIVPNYPPVEVFPKDTVICSKDGLAILYAPAEGGNSVYTWEWDGPGTITQFNDSVYNAAPPTTSTYIVTVTDECGTIAVDTMRVEVINCVLQVANAYSPNGDGKNDIFFVNFIEQYPDNVVYLFNRWGNKIFEAQSYKNDWDFENVPSGTYFYVVDPGDGTDPLKGYVAVFKE